MRPDVETLVGLGRLSSQSSAEKLASQERHLVALDGLALDEDDVAGLLGILPADMDDAFGLAWTAVHHIEASPTWPTTALDAADGYWAKVLRARLARASRDIGQH